MSPRTTGILAVVALALGLFVYLHEIEGERSRQAARDEAAKIHAGLDADAIDALEIETLDGVAARFERRDGRWWLVAPFESRAEASALDAIASALADLPREGSVAGDRALDGFGLGEDARVVRFEVGGETRGLRIGRTTPVGGHRYVARLADDAVAYVESFRLTALSRNLSDLRDRRIFDFDSGRVAALEIEWPEPGGADHPADEAEAGVFTLRLERDAGGAYGIVAPIRAEADEEAVRDLLSDLAYLRASDFVDTRTPEAEAALGQVALRFRWQLDGEGPDGGDAQPVAAAEAGSAVIAGPFGSGLLVEVPDGSLYTIAEDRLEDFPRSLDAYRFKRLSAFELASARALTLELATRVEEQSSEALRVHLTLEQAGWRSADRAVDPDAISRLVRTLSSLSADGRVADAMGDAELASLGLAPPRGRLVVEGGADPDAPPQTLAALELGRMDPVRGLFVRRTDRDTVFLLAPESAEALPWSADAWTRNFEAPPTEEADAEDPEAEGVGGVESLEDGEFGALD
jgi:hypothetical protein